MLEPIENQYLHLGRINRSHGISGEVLIISELYVPELLEEIELVHLQNGRGDLIPARIASVRTEEKNNRLSFFVQFEHVTDRNEAERLKDYPVYVDRDKAKPFVERLDAPADYTAYQVYGEDSRHLGEVEETLENPAHPIIQVGTRDGRQLLIPFVDEYILECDPQQQVIYCRNLHQLEPL